MKPDGRKSNNGQPKKQDKSKKKHIAIYEELGEIEELGGMDKVREFLKWAFQKELARKRYDKPSKHDASADELRRPLTPNSAA